MHIKGKAPVENTEFRLSKEPFFEILGCINSIGQIGPKFWPILVNL